MASRWLGRVALVIGASSGGIGAAIAKQFAQLGLKVVGCARNIEKIKALGVDLEQSNAPGSVHAIKCDITQENEILSMFEEIKEKYGGVDVCVNSAGINAVTSILDGKTEDWRRMFDTNVIGLSICTREAIKSMRERQVDDGHVFHINSIAGHKVIGPTSRVHMYSATKFSVTALTEGLRQELREIKSHIRITSISGGVVRTEFARRAYGEERAEKLYGSMKTILTPEDMADAVVYALLAPPHVQVHDILVRPVDQQH